VGVSGGEEEANIILNSLFALADGVLRHGALDSFEEVLVLFLDLQYADHSSVVL
jgi:hypothetical protein